MELKYGSYCHATGTLSISKDDYCNLITGVRLTDKTEAVGEIINAEPVDGGVKFTVQFFPWFDVENLKDPEKLMNGKLVLTAPFPGGGADE